ncbi:Pyrophosphate--fructose 6-phosphate 1-phosphotransferase subunit alpha [Zea mays]|uniref:Pyrophosphate--fructose 6-phosphate 1-phosphotransferase subunit alpha n=2 Tax=Zea mays TaxID=4577 RepID=A0A3L6DDJ3_MAIZE|nr:Pyrophosphate--fructose 6-phosphate 1-phosphotransferase subunit alpha 2 [Zea mays]PWZ06177.1 Pyrophosphate--fructose 6-phosphate 1-phosphotransferase subunit alpha [Zea mays]
MGCRIGVVFSGRQSPGGHNVIWGLYDVVKAHNSNSKIIGFLGGTDGLFAQKTIEITDEALPSYKNQGGYDMLGRTRDQIRTTEQVKATIGTCQALKLDALVIIGGVTSNTDAAQLAETFAQLKCPTKVVGVPVTLNGDLKNQFVETTVGFDTICKYFLVTFGHHNSTSVLTKVNSQLISNACIDALSAEKYYYFIRMMGRKASHVALECALQSHPNMVILGEEVSVSKLTIFDITKQICDAVQARAEKDKYHGVVLIPEGLVESIPELYALLQEIHGLHNKGVSVENISSHLSPWASALFEFLPPFIRKQLLLHPGSDDSAQLSQIEIEKLLAQLVETEMDKRLSMMTVKRWSRGAATSQIGKPAVHMASVDLKGKAYELLRQNSSSFMMEDIYRNPGPLQFEGSGADTKPISLCVEDQDYMGRIKKLQEYLEKVKSIVKPGCSQDVLKAAVSAMASVTEMLTIMSSLSFSGQATI